MVSRDPELPESFEMALVLARLCFVLGSIEVAGGSLSDDELLSSCAEKDLKPEQLERFLKTLADQSLLVRRERHFEITTLGRQWLSVTGRVLDASL